MAERSYLRDSTGPRVIDSCVGGSNAGRRTRPSRTTTSQRHQKNERPSLELDFVNQPPEGVALGYPVGISVKVSLRLPPTFAADRRMAASTIDTSHLLAVASLVADNPRNGERVPLEANILTGQKLFDSVHRDDQQQMPALSSRVVTLGYLSFPSLLIRQSGLFRFRITLFKMQNHNNAGGTSVVAVDSEPIKVDRRCVPVQPRRHLR
ncbi:hypothetical protein K470DRAFT_114072 [Piedraia hortae CBS 480.64]|uniref:Velvet domain-containing protein n=1 Tax=Piedraia hortae CBS 480.64 TaxID=1314780 RepID=A0A6A7BW28_9PEZI|nr:hypothetical protein K470DRAFT_114072 [Piedraia hortae CBS 480.64]